MGTFSVLEAEMVCLRKLLNFKKWKYFINLTGQEFPLKTNKELVEILEALDGANVVDGTLLRPSMYDFHRWTLARKPPPHTIRPVKGSVHVAINRYMADYAVHNAKAQDFYMWLRETSFPDESFFSSLNYNPNLRINGSFIGKIEDLPSERFIARYKVWRGFQQPCGGKYERDICVLGVADLWRAYHDVGLFVNKLHLNYQYLALDCLEEVMHEKTLRQFNDNTTIDTNFYKQLYFVQHKIIL